MALKLGELSTILSADDRPLEQGLDRAQGRVAQFGERLQGAATAIGAGAALALGVALAGALELDAAQAKLSAQIGDPALADQAGRVAGEVYARGFGESAAAVGETLRGILTSGLVDDGATDAELENLTVKAQALADTFGVDVVQTARAAGQMIRTGLAGNADEALDIIARNFQATGDLAGDALDTVTEYATQFRKLGIDGQTALGILSQGLQAGARDADTVADALKEFTILALDGNAVTQEAFTSLGLGAERVTGQLAAGGDTAAAAFDVVLDRLRAVQDPLARSQLAVALFGTKAEDLGDALYALDPSAAVTALGQVDGAAGRMADTLEQSASQQLEAFKRSAQQALVEELAKALPVLQQLGGFLRENSEIVGPLVVTLGVLAGVVMAVTAGTQAWAAAQTLLAVAMMLPGPGLIVLAIGLIVGGIALLWSNSSAFRDFWIGAWEMISGAAVAVWEWVRANWPLILAMLTGPIGLAVLAITRNWESIKGGAVAAKDWVVDQWNGLVDWVAGLGGRISAGARGMWDGISAGFRDMVNRLIGLWNNLSFTVGGGSFAGISVPSVTFSTPDIPYMAVGGETTRGGMAMVGERGREAVYLPEGASVRPNRYGGQGGHAEATVRELLLRGEFRISGSDLILVLRDRVAVDGGDVQAVIGSNT